MFNKSCLKMFLIVVTSILYFSCETDGLIDLESSPYDPPDISDYTSINGVYLLTDDYENLLDLYSSLGINSSDEQIYYGSNVVDVNWKKHSWEPYYYLGYLDFNNSNVSDSDLDIVKNFYNLEYLDVHDEANITAFPSDFFDDMPNLESINIYGCVDLVNIEALMNNQTIKTLVIRNCMDLDISEQLLFSITSLENLILDGPFESGIELNSSISNLTNLKNIDIRYVDLIGNLPIELFAIDDIEEIDLTYTMISGELPDIAGYHDDIGYLNLSHNEISGNIPDSYYDFPFDVYINLSHNHLSGDVSDDICYFNSFYIDNNEFCDYVPSCAQDNQNCEHEDDEDDSFNEDDYYLINGNYYRKVDYDALENIITLSNFPDDVVDPLDLHECNWSCIWNGGDISNSVCYISFCNFYNDGLVDNGGDVFEEFAKMSDMGSLSISNENNVVGPIPSSIGQLTKLEFLTLDNLPDLIGSLPDEIGDLSNLISLSIQDCVDMSGDIPSSIWNLLNLESLSFESLGSELKFPFTSDIQNLSQLETLNLYNVNFKDGFSSLPSGLFELDDLQYIYISYCDLEGEIPDNIGNLDNISYINLSHNNLTGGLPESVMNLSSLYDLDLSYNDLSGSLPDNLCSWYLDYIGCLDIDLDNNGYCDQEDIEICYCTEESSIYLDVCP